VVPRASLVNLERRKSLVTARIRTPDFAACSLSLHQLSHLGSDEKGGDKNDDDDDDKHLHAHQATTDMLMRQSNHAV